MAHRTTSTSVVVPSANRAVVDVDVELLEAAKRLGERTLRDRIGLDAEAGDQLGVVIRGLAQVGDPQADGETDVLAVVLHHQLLDGFAQALGENPGIE